jgi:hypothetical protein
MSKSASLVSPLFQSSLLPVSSSGSFAFASSTLVSFCPSTGRPDSNADAKSTFGSQDECIARTRWYYDSPHITIRSRAELSSAIRPRTEGSSEKGKVLPAKTYGTEIGRLPICIVLQAEKARQASSACRERASDDAANGTAHTPSFQLSFPIRVSAVQRDHRQPCYRAARSSFTGRSSDCEPFGSGGGNKRHKTRLRSTGK